MHTHPSDLHTKREAARLLRLSLRSIDNLLKARALEFIRMGRAVRISSDAIERFKAAHTVKASS
jgi:excisionase family DNA binding protein